MRGVYTAALVQVMLEAGLAFPWVGGISAGSTNTVNMVSRDPWRTREAFVRLTTDPQAGGWGSFARRQGYFNSEHIYQHTARPEESIPFDLPAFAALGPTGGFATDAAAADSYERMLVVSTRPAGYRKPEEKRPGAFRRLFRRYPAVAEAIIDRPAHYNRTMNELEQGRREGRVYLYQPTRMPVENGELRYDRVVSAYEAGLVQARAELPRILGFLGCD